MKRITIFASGTGSNAVRIARYFEGRPDVQINLIVSNKADAPVLASARELGIPTLVINRSMFHESDEVVRLLRENKTDLIVLAGFLWLVPASLITAFPNRIINIHPALLPKFGGKGMYGHHVHDAVIAAGEKESGITIHFVNAHFDEGEHIAQFRCPVLPGDTADSVAQRVQQLEHAHFAETIDGVLRRTDVVI